MPVILKRDTMRRILAIAAGLAAALLVMRGVEAGEEWLYPAPVTVDATDPATFAALLAALPVAAQALLVAGWFVGPFAGAWLALRLCDWGPAGWAVVALSLLGAVAGLVSVAHPLWMQVGTVLAPLAGGWAAARLHRRPYPGEPLLG